MTWVSNCGRSSADFPNFSFLKLDCSQLHASFDDPMGANESARQEGSNDTMSDSQLEQNCFTVRKLVRVQRTFVAHRKHHSKISEHKNARTLAFNLLTSEYK